MKIFNASDIAAHLDHSPPSAYCLGEGWIALELVRETCAIFDPHCNTGQVVSLPSEKDIQARQTDIVTARNLHSNSGGPCGG